MPITTTTRKTISYGNGINKTFTFDFPADADSDIRVHHISDTGVETVITDFTVSRTDSGGTITLGTGVSAPSGTEKIVVYRDTSLTQPYDFIVAGTINAEQIEDAINKLTMGIQEVKEADARQLTLSIASTASGTLPNPEANTWLAWNNDATAIVNKTDPTATIAAERLAAEAAAAAALASQNAAAGSAGDASDSASEASGYATAALGHANDAAASSATASGYLYSCSSQVALATAAADLAEDWAISDVEVEPGKRSAKWWADRAYTTVYSGVEPTFAPGTKMWFYQSSPPDGWEIVAGLSDMLLAVGNYVEVGGGNVAGNWTFSGFELAASGTHTHTSSHSHTLAHTHTGASHSHTMAHTHAGVDHLHSGASHSHTFDGHTHTQDSHTHSVSSSTTLVAPPIYEGSNVYVVSAVSSPSGYGSGSTGSTSGNTSTAQGTTGAADRSLTTGGASTSTTSTDGTGNTGAASTSTTSTDAPTSSSAGNHNHELTHSGGDRPRACVGIIAEYIGTAT